MLYIIYWSWHATCLGMCIFGVTVQAFPGVVVLFFLAGSHPPWIILECGVSSCPAGYLRHRAYCVLCLGVWKAQRKQTHQATKTIKNGHHKLTKNHCKLTPGGGVPEALGGGPGTISGPGVTQDVPGTPGAEKVMKSSSFPRSFPNFGAPQNHEFPIFFGVFFVFFLLQTSMVYVLFLNCPGSISHFPV